MSALLGVSVFLSSPASSDDVVALAEAMQAAGVVRPFKRERVRGVPSVQQARAADILRWQMHGVPWPTGAADALERYAYKGGGRSRGALRASLVAE
jgi:hypothetical protein